MEVDFARGHQRTFQPVRILVAQRSFPNRLQKIFIHGRFASARQALNMQLPVRQTTYRLGRSTYQGSSVTSVSLFRQAQVASALSGPTPLRPHRVQLLPTILDTTRHQLLLTIKDPRSEQRRVRPHRRIFSRVQWHCHHNRPIPAPDVSCNNHGQRRVDFPHVRQNVIIESQYR